jgi:outer membrane immunogenic protein
MLLRSIAMAGLALGFAVTTASAADLIIPSEPEPVMDDMSGTGFDWAGMYVGAEAGGLIYDEDYRYGLAGLNVGVNMMATDNLLVGIEGDLQYLTGEHGDYAHLVVLGRGGVVVSPTVLLYAAAGVGVEYNLNYDTRFGIFEGGIGAEVAVTDNVSLRGQVLGLGFFNGDAPGVKATVGLDFHM